MTKDFFGFKKAERDFDKALGFEFIPEERQTASKRRKKTYFPQPRARYSNGSHRSDTKEIARLSNKGMKAFVKWIKKDRLQEKKDKLLQKNRQLRKDEENIIDIENLKRQNEQLEKEIKRYKQSIKEAKEGSKK